MQSTASETKTKSWAMFSYGLQHLDTPMLANQQKITFINTVCHLENFQGTMADMDRWWEKVKEISTVGMSGSPISIMLLWSAVLASHGPAGCVLAQVAVGNDQHPRASGNRPPPPRF